MASKSCTALDLVTAAIMGFDPMDVPTVRQAYERRMGPGSLADVAVFGGKVESLILDDFKKPSTMSTERIPRLVVNAVRRIASDRARIDASKCKKCGICVRDCPSKAMSLEKGTPPVIDYGKCISCYCCQELCPEGAVYVSRPPLRKLIG